MIINKDNTANLSDFKIGIEPDILNNLSKEYLLGIIIFIQNYCKIKIEPKFTNLKHDIFIILKNEKAINEYFLSFKKKIQQNIISKKIKI